MRNVTIFLARPPAGLTDQQLNDIIGQVTELDSLTARIQRGPGPRPELQARADKLTAKLAHVPADAVRTWFHHSFRGPYNPAMRYTEAVSYQVDDDLDDLYIAEMAFDRFNIGDPDSDPVVAEYRRAGNRSLSVGDVVLIDEAPWFCGSIGWDLLDDFHLDEARNETVLDRVRSELGPYHQLVNVEHDDGVSDEQLGQLFSGDVTEAVESIDEWIDEAQSDGIAYALNEVLSQELRDAIEQHELEDEARDLVTELDTGNPFDELLARTGNKLLVYKLGDSDANADEPDLIQAHGSNDEAYLERMEGEQRTKLTAVLANVGADVTLPSNQAAIETIINENLYHGGVIYALWYGPVTELAKLICDRHFENEGHDLPRTITFNNVQVLVWNGWAGAGFCEVIEGEITLDWDPGRLRLDGYGTGSWAVDSCFGFHLPAIANDPTIAIKETVDA